MSNESAAPTLEDRQPITAASASSPDGSEMSITWMLGGVRQGRRPRSSCVVAMGGEAIARTAWVLLGEVWTCAGGRRAAAEISLHFTAMARQLLTRSKEHEP